MCQCQLLPLLFCDLAGQNFCCCCPGLCQCCIHLPSLPEPCRFPSLLWHDLIAFAYHKFIPGRCRDGQPFCVTCCPGHLCPLGRLPLCGGIKCCHSVVPSRLSQGACWGLFPLLGVWCGLLVLDPQRLIEQPVPGLFLLVSPHSNPEDTQRQGPVQRCLVDFWHYVGGLCVPRTEHRIVDVVLCDPPPVCH